MKFAATTAASFLMLLFGFIFTLTQATPAIPTSDTSTTLSLVTCINTSKIKAALFDALAADLGSDFGVNFRKVFDGALSVSHMNSASCLKESDIEFLSKKVLMIYEAGIPETQDTVSSEFDRVIDQFYY
jgi:hypothetical protein